MSKDNFGDRMKMYEATTAGQRLMPLLPAMIRIDGKGFSKFTKGLRRPYDQRLSDIMVETTKALVAESNALVGYTQSDEISLVLHSDNMKSQIYFDGRIQKMVGDLAAVASLVFNDLIREGLPEKADLRPRFDCRVWNVPNKVEAANTLLWREQDATKNSISMAARSVYSHNQVNNKNGAEKQDMLMDKGINWNDYPAFFKRGTFVRRETELRAFTMEELDKLPEKHAARQNPHLEVERQVIKIVDMPPFGKVVNRVGVIFNGDTPLTDADAPEMW
jgi:tRNA(His) 5'-end guanylyltransferase